MQFERLYKKWERKRESFIKNEAKELKRSLSEFICDHDEKRMWRFD